MMSVIARNNVLQLGAAGPTVVFGHGFGTDGASWWPVAKHIAADHRVLLFDHIGFGRSDRLAYSDRHGSLDGYRDDLLQILEQQAPGPVIYVGHSIGGMIGLLASIKKPDRFSRLVLLNSTPHFIDDRASGYVGGFSRQQIEASLELMGADYAAWAEAIAPMAIGRANDPEQIRVFGQGLHSLDTMIARRFGRLVLYVDLRQRLAEVSTPASILQCLDDEFAPVAVGRYLQQALPGSTLTLLQASGHCPQITQPEVVVNALRDVLATVKTQ
jgi:sigma-B regulation protein RsbQ